MLWYFPENDLIAKGSGITADTSNYQFPVTLIYQSRLACDVWRSNTAYPYQQLFIDLGGAYKTADFPNGLDFLVDSWNANDPTVCAAVEYQLGYYVGTVANYFGGWHALPLYGDVNTPQRYNITLDPTTVTQVIAIRFTEGSPSQFFQVGKLFLGTPFDGGVTAAPSGTDYTRGFAERVNKDYSVLGQRFSEKRAAYWTADFTMPYVGETLEGGLRLDLFEALGTYTPFWVIVDPTSVDTSELEFPRYCVQSVAPSEALVGVGGGGRQWAVKISLEKQL